MLADASSLALSDAECQCRYTERVPIYEYRCTNGHQFDVMQRMSDDPLTECTECGAPVQKVLNAARDPLQGLGLLQHRLRPAQRLEVVRLVELGRRRLQQDGESGSSSGSGSGSGSSDSSSSSSTTSGGSSSSSSSGSQLEHRLELLEERLALAALRGRRFSSRPSLAGCGGSSTPKTVDPASVEAAIRADVVRQGGALKIDHLPRRRQGRSRHDLRLRDRAGRRFQSRRARHDDDRPTASTSPRRRRRRSGAARGRVQLHRTRRAIAPTRTRG